MANNKKEVEKTQPAKSVEKVEVKTTPKVATPYNSSLDISKQKMICDTMFIVVSLLLIVYLIIGIITLIDAYTVTTMLTFIFGIIPYCLFLTVFSIITRIIISNQHNDNEKNK